MIVGASSALLTTAGGQLRCRLGAGVLGPVWMQGREVVRRIFITARDEQWQEVPPSQWSLEAVSHAQLVMKARHESECVDFSWTGRLTLAADGIGLDFAFEGSVGRDMRACRLDLVVLLPTDMLEASAVRFDGGAWQPIGLGLAPQLIVDGLPTGIGAPFTALQARAADGSELLATFAGDLFELEDQRNWGDSSYKIYCTPLHFGFPRAFSEGTRLEHSVAVRMQAAAPERAMPRPADVDARHFPAVGLERGFGSDGPGLAGSVAAIELGTMPAPISATLPVGCGVEGTSNLTIADGRFGGGTKGLSIGHVAPEAAVGGPIALVRDGDPIEIDVEAGRMDVFVPSPELERRRAALPTLELGGDSSVLAKFARLATSASSGARCVARDVVALRISGLGEQRQQIRTFDEHR